MASRVGEFINLEIMKHQSFDSHEGDKDKLLESFCDYSNRLNPKDDLSDPRHWDIGEENTVDVVRSCESVSTEQVSW